ncbi:MAG TPA: TetR/AcrR family transcriptional regulator [Lysobacter sp.]|nr:TetR/AcrR family transcriptional regulator [Lysobacter sp.]
MPASPRPAPPAKPAGPGRPKDPGKRAAILEAAKRLFVEQGFAGTSVEQIAAAAGVSKLTVYSHFGDKDTLFVEAVKAKCMAQMPDEVFVRPRRDIRASLTDIAEHFYALVSSEEAIGLQRVLMTDGRDNPKLCQLFWEAGPARINAGMVQFLREAVAAGLLDIPDTELAAEHFLCLLKRPVNMRVLLPGLCPACEDPDRDHVGEVVDLFMRAYGPRVPVAR